MSSNFAERWSSTAFTKLDESMRGITLHLYFSSAMSILARFLRVAVLGVGVWLVINQAITLGAVIAANVLGRISYSLVQNAMLRWREVVTAKRAYLRIKSSLTNRTLSTISLPDDMRRVSLTISNLRYRYPGNTSSIFRNLNLVLNPGELLFVVGSSASGKTTFARLVTGLLTPRDGNVRLGEVDLFRLQQRTQTHEVGKLPQDVILFHGTVRENIARMSEGQMDMVIQAAKFAGVHEAIIDLPAGYDTVIQENEPLLSFGQRKGVALARAFYGQPQLIVLDEPIPHLDHQARSDLLKGMRRMNQVGSIIVLTTQSISLCKYADKVLVLDGIRHRVLQSPDEILSYQKERLLSHSDQRKGNIRGTIIGSMETSNGNKGSKQRSA
jgi:ABC-type protease/lipase transport system fused ATPase/permease subunit